MRVEDLMTQSVQSCRPEDSLEEAARVMWEHDCGALPVCTASDGERRAIGMITDRDICMGALFQSKPLRELRVSEVMAKKVRVCNPRDSLAGVENSMRENRIRRLPVVSPDGALLGMISLADLAREAARERSKQRKEITETEVGDTLAAICRSSAQPSLT
jgi:CBS domain-containing protein